MKLGLYIIIAISLFAFVLTKMDGVNYILDTMEGKPQKEIFKTFHYLHEKKYKLNSEEGLKRYRIFKQNVAWANEENARLGKIIYRITKFMDLTHEEFVEQMLLKPEAMKKNMNLISNRVFEKYTDMNADDVDYNLRDDDDHNLRNEKNNFLQNQDQDVDNMKWESNIKNQGSCGSCWAFAAVGAVENAYHKLTGSLTLFSEQYLVNCDNNDNGCNGGWPSGTFKWIRERKWSCCFGKLTLRCIKRGL